MKSEIKKRSDRGIAESAMENEKVKVTDFASQDIISRLEGRGNLLEFIAETDGTPLGEALREYALSDADISARLERLSTPLCDDNEYLNDETCQMIAGTNLALTQSRLESYVLCHFSYFLKYIIKLDQNKPAKFSASDIGTFIHHILEVFVSRAEKAAGAGLRGGPAAGAALYGVDDQSVVCLHVRLHRAGVHAAAVCCGALRHSAP